MVRVRLFAKEKVTPGERLPSSRDLARQFKNAPSHRHDCVGGIGSGRLGHDSIKAKCYQVTETLPDKFLQAKGSLASTKTDLDQEIEFARFVEIASHSSGEKFKHSFPSGFPDVRLFPMKEFKSHLGDAFNSKDILSYGDPVGHPKLIDEVGKYIRRVRSVSDREIIITNGSQEALFLSAQCLIALGDFVAVESLGYPPAIEALKFAGGKFVPIRVDKEGLCVDDLEKQLKKKKIKCLYTTPLHQYPTTVTLSACAQTPPLRVGSEEWISHYRRRL